ncbi:hypothetical protein NFX37_10830 [Serratia marcescens]|nr:hypothetical protein NFX37_10830 [Serratia marcescens]
MQTSRRCAFTANTLFTLLQQRAALQWPRLRVEQRPALPGLGPAVQINEAFTVSVTDGRTASQLAELTAADACWSMSP